VCEDASALQVAAYRHVNMHVRRPRFVADVIARPRSNIWQITRSGAIFASKTKKGVARATPLEAKKNRS
jgi:hypothetical protein